MPTIKVLTHRAPGLWNDLVDPARVIHVGFDHEPNVQILGGFNTGQEASVAIRIDLPDGRAVVTVVPLAQLISAAEVLKAAHGTPR